MSSSAFLWKWRNAALNVHCDRHPASLTLIPALALPPTRQFLRGPLPWLVPCPDPNAAQRGVAGISRRLMKTKELGPSKLGQPHRRPVIRLSAFVDPSPAPFRYQPSPVLPRPRLPTQSAFTQMPHWMPTSHTYLHRPRINTGDAVGIFLLLHPPTRLHPRRFPRFEVLVLSVCSSPHLLITRKRAGCVGGDSALILRWMAMAPRSHYGILRVEDVM